MSRREGGHPCPNLTFPSQQALVLKRGIFFTANSWYFIEVCELYFCITDEISEYFLRFLADFYNLRGGKSLESVFYPARIITTTDLNVGVEVVTMKTITPQLLIITPPLPEVMIWVLGLTKATPPGS